MITPDSIVTSTGILAGNVGNGDLIDTILDGEGYPTMAPAFLLPGTVDHMCQQIESLVSGAKVICSNNAVVFIDDPMRGGKAIANCQRIGGARIAVLVDGILRYEHAIATPYKVVPVIQLLVPGGAIIAGQEEHARILITGAR